MNTATLIGTECSIDDVRAVNTPEPTVTHYPIPHEFVLNSISSAAYEHKLAIERTQLVLTHEGQRFFGLLHLASGNGANTVIGVRNSHDKSASTTILFGGHVMICSNMDFSAEIKLTRKHTRYVLRDLSGMVEEAVSYARKADEQRRLWIQRMQQRHLTDAAANDFIIRALDVGAVTATKIPAVLQAYREPEHDEFKSRRLWSLYNAFTEVYKSCPSVDTLVNYSRRLNQLVTAA